MELEWNAFSERAILLELEPELDLELQPPVMNSSSSSPMLTGVHRHEHGQTESGARTKLEADMNNNDDGRKTTNTEIHH